MHLGKSERKREREEESSPGRTLAPNFSAINVRVTYVPPLYILLDTVDPAPSG